MWMIAGWLAFALVIVNLIFIFQKKYKYCGVLVFGSLSSGLITMLCMYSIVNGWVQADEISALMDVVPTMKKLLIVIVLVGVILNGIAVFANYKHTKK